MVCLCETEGVLWIAMCRGGVVPVSNKFVTRCMHMIQIIDFGLFLTWFQVSTELAQWSMVSSTCVNSFLCQNEPWILEQTPFALIYWSSPNAHLC